MFHLGFCDPGRGLFYRSAGSIRNSIGPMTLDQRLAPPRKIRRAVERAKILRRTSSADSSPISSRVSQNAAALLFDLGTVDIR
jgi:hypothetical protein